MRCNVAKIGVSVPISARFAIVITEGALAESFTLYAGDTRAILMKIVVVTWWPRRMEAVL